MRKHPPVLCADVVKDDEVADVCVWRFQLEGQLGIKSAELRKYLDSLARPKIKALRARTIDKSVKMEDADFSQLVFEVNSKLPQEVVDRKSKKAKPKVRFEMGRVDVAAVIEEVDTEVQEERRFAIDAALVRTMKSSRSMKQSLLIPDVCKQLAFLFQVRAPLLCLQRPVCLRQDGPG